MMREIRKKNIKENFGKSNLRQKIPSVDKVVLSIKFTNEAKSQEQSSGIL